MDQPEESASPRQEAAACSPQVARLSPEMRKQCWLEMMAVLALFLGPAVFNAVANLIWPTAVAPPFTEAMLLRLVHAVSVTAPVLYILWKSGEPFSTFGLKHPWWIADPLLAVGIWLVQVAAGVWLSNALSGILSEGAYRTAWASIPYPHSKFEPSGSTCLLLATAQLAGGFSQELVMRGYLIPRFERLLNSTVASVLLTTVLFAAYHAYQGPGGVVGSAMFGLVYAGAFCATRRIWPLALAHAMTNIIIVSGR